MYLHEVDQTEGSRIARGVATVGALISGSMLAASCGTLFIRVADEVSVDPQQTPYPNPTQVEQYDAALEFSAQVGLAGLGLAAVGLIVNSTVHAIQRHRLHSK